MTTRTRHGEWRAWLLDLSLAALATYAALLLTAEIAAALSAPQRSAAQALAAGYGAALLARRVAPAAVLAVQAVAAAGYTALGLPAVMLGPAVLVSVYTVGARLERRPALVLLGTAEAVLAALLWLGPAVGGIPSWVQFSGILAGAWFLGDFVRRWRVAAAAHAGRAAELEQAREELARLAVTAERVRIARELHDVVAHSMSVIAMHAGSGRLALARDPAGAGRALEVIEGCSRDTLAELRRLVTVLRDTDEATPLLAPAPGLPDMHRLVAEVAATGVTVDVHTDGDLAAVPDGVSLAAYRILQEALTNVVRHAGPARATLSVVIRDGEVVVAVTDDGVAGRPTPAGSRGHGTIGMRERAALYGGELTAGPAAGRGWRVSARLPYGEVRP